MNAQPQPLWSEQWRGVTVQVFATGDTAALSLEEAAAVLSADEHQRAARFHFLNDRERWVRARALLRMCLGARLNCPPGSLQFQTAKAGKPHLNPPVKGVEFNLSHSGEYAAVAVGEEIVGVDIETWNPGMAVHEVAELVCDAGEVAAIRESAEPQRLFRRLWTGKEAVMKCCGHGLQIPPAAIRLEFAAGTPVAAERTDFDPSDFPDWPRRYHLASFEDPGRWTLAVTVSSEARPQHAGS